MLVSLEVVRRQEILLHICLFMRSFNSTTKQDYGAQQRVGIMRKEIKLGQNYNQLISYAQYYLCLAPTTHNLHFMSKVNVSKSHISTTSEPSKITHVAEVHSR